MSAKSGTRSDSEPEAFGWCAIGWFVAVDQAKARLALWCLDVEADSAAIGKLRMTT
jgi:hypothetical protein